jgi:hypothetical protein
MRSFNFWQEDNGGMSDLGEDLLPAGRTSACDGCGAEAPLQSLSAYHLSLRWPTRHRLMPSPFGVVSRFTHQCAVAVADSRFVRVAADNTDDRFDNSLRRNGQLPMRTDISFFVRLFNF